MKSPLDPELSKKPPLLNPWQLPWQKKSWQFLCHSFTQHTLAHAFVIEGGEGHGTTDFVTAFTQQLHCQNLVTSNTRDSTDTHPCQICSSCEQIANHVYPDYKILQLNETKKQISVDQIRELTRFFQQSGHGQSYRILLIKDAELMNHAAMNALLKTLEEPGDNSLLFIQTKHPLNLTATIRSRCLKLSLTQIKSEQVIPWLDVFNQNRLQQKQLRQLLLMSDNQPLTALALLQTDVLQLRSEMIQLFYDCLDGHCTVNQFMEGIKKVDIDQIWAWIGQDIMRVHTGNNQRLKSSLVLTTLYNSIQKQLFVTNHADKGPLLREFLIKSIANSAFMSHS